jgi:probable phosphoglycerate mutase
MRLLLVRHAVTAETGKVLSGRLPDVPLSAGGVEAAGVAGRALAGSAAVAIFTSPMERCRQTAALVGRATGLRARVDKRYAEVDYGAWSGRKLSDLRRLAAWRALMASPARFRFPGGETLDEVRQRSVAATEALAGAYPGAVVVVVTHADVVRALLCHYLGMPLDLLHRLEVGPTSLTEIDFTNGFVRVARVNHDLVPG